jgi:preprotein translocase subunit SecD
MKIKSFLLFMVLVFISSSCRTVTALFERGGTKFTIELKTTEANAEGVTDEAVQVLSARLDALEIRNRVHKTHANRVEVLAYGKPDVERVKKLLLAESRFELAKIAGEHFQTYPTREAAEQAMGGTVLPNRRVLPFNDRDEGAKNTPKQWVIVEMPPVIDGRVVRDAQAYSPTGSDQRDHVVNFRLNPEGAQKFGDWTGKNIGKYLAIVLNDEVKSAPVIKGQIFDSGQIEGKFTKAAAEDLALVLKSGYLTATLTLIDESTFE